MRIIILNMAYGTGCAKNFPHHLIRMHHYIRTPHKHLQHISNYLKERNPDIIGLVEIDAGSFRTQYCNQISQLAETLSFSPFSHLKYNSLWGANSMPILSRQHNAILYRIQPKSTLVHFLENGMKQLILEVEFEHFSLFLVHLSLLKRTREKQLKNLEKILPLHRPFIIAGDFNLFSGSKEIQALQEKFKLKSLNLNQTPTFPAWQPKHELDFALTTPEIKASLEVDCVQLSDHCPLIIDIESITAKIEK